MTTLEPWPEGAVWVIRDPEGRIVDYSTEPMTLAMTTQLGEQFEQVAEVLLNQAEKAKEN